MSRTGALAIAMLGILVGWLARGPAPSTAGHVAPVDSSAIDSLKAAMDAARLRDSIRLDSLRDAFKRRPIREVVRYLPGAVREVPGPAVVESVTVAAPVVRETADSLATCRNDREELTDSVALWRAREASQREAADLLRSRPPVEPSESVSRPLWGGIGFAAGLTTAAIIILSR